MSKQIDISLKPRKSEHLSGSEIFGMVIVMSDIVASKCTLLEAADWDRCCRVMI
jgi:hypothetical protein